MRPRRIGGDVLGIKREAEGVGFWLELERRGAPIVVGLDIAIGVGRFDMEDARLLC